MSSAINITSPHRRAGTPEREDPSGKGKIAHTTERVKVLSAAFIIGLCIGLVVAERVYIATNAASGGGAATSTPIRTHSAALQALSTGDAQSAALLSVLQRVAPSGEVLIALSNKIPFREGTLLTWLEAVRQAGVTNYLVVALDEETATGLQQRGNNVFHMPVPVPEVQADTGGNHAVSTLKFGVLRRFLQLGWAVLLSDVDIAVLQNPFHHLYRDSDVEGSSDGFDDRTAYGSVEGFDDPSMGWSRYAQYMKHFNFNSGLFYLRANNRTIDLMTRLETRLSKVKYWDQTAYNEEIFLPSHDDYKSPQVSVRVMNIYKFMNSKVLFKDVRHRPPETRPPMPVMVHVNYHPDKHPRMQAVLKYYVHKDLHALDPFPGGSQPGT